MPPRQEWTDAEDDQLRDLAATGTPISKMAKAVGRHPSSVKRRLDRLGIHGDRTQTQAATRAKVIDAKARRAALETKLLEDAEKLRQQLWQPHTYFDWGGKDHDFDEHTVPEPTPTDKLKLMQAVGAAVDRSLKISVHDVDTGVAEATSLLDQFEAALNAAADASGLDQTEAP